MNFRYKGFRVEMYSELSFVDVGPAKWFAMVGDRRLTFYKGPPCDTEEDAAADAKTWIDRLGIDGH
jgi:hypothetical protein